METENGKINYRIILDTSGMAAERDSVAGMFADMGKSAQVEGAKIDNAFSSVAANIGKAFASLMAVSTFTALSQKIMAVRGEFQQLEVAFETMLGSAEKANSLMNQLVRTAATTPFGLQDVAGGAKQLLAYGIAADEVNETLVRLGDIAAGLSIPLNDLVYLYGTTMTQGRVYTQDMRQFMGRGIPVAEELAKQFGVTKDKVSELVTAGKVGFPEIKKAIISMTSEGGKFGGLMEKQSHTITGQISNIEDAIDMMFNDLGKQSEGVINTALGAVTFLIEHYQQFGTILLSIVAAYGEYKAALMLISAYNSYIASQEAAITTQREAALAAAIAEAQAEGADTAATNANTAAKQANKTAIDLEVAAIMRELEMKAGQAAIDHDLARQELVTAQQRMAIAEQNFAARQQEYMAAVRSGNMSAVATARANLETAAKEKQAAAYQLNAVQTNIETTAKTKETAATKLAAFQTSVDTANKNANTAATGLMTMATNLATKAVQALNAAWKANPFGLILSAITLVIGAISMFKMHTDDATDSMEKFRETAMEERNKLETNRAVLSSLSKESSLYKKAVSELSQMAEEHGTKLEVENGVIKDQEKALKDLSNAINKAAAEKVVAEEASKAHKAAMDAEKEAMDRVKDAASKAAHVNTDGLTDSYTEASANIRNMTESQWDYISQIVMSHAREIADAYAQSGEAGEAAAQRTLDEVNKYLTALGAGDEEIKAFQGVLINYINESAEGFQGAYKDLSRVEHQMQGVVNATDGWKQSFESLKGAATDTYDELKNKQEGIKQKIDEINASPLNPQVKDEQVLYLRGLLYEINGLMKTAGTGSINAAREALDAAKKELDDAAFGSDAYKQAKAKYDKAKADYDKMYKATYGGSKSTKPTKSTKSGGAKNDPKQAAYDVEEIQKQMQEQMDEFIKDLKDAYGAGVTSAMKEGTEKQIQQIKDDTKNKLKALDESIEQLRDKQAEADKQIWLKKNPKKKEYEYPTPAELSIQQFLDKYPTLKAEYEARVAQITQAGEDAQNKITDEQAKSESAAMSAYLEEYGSYYNKRQAIIAQYNQKIAEATEKGLKGEVLSLQKQMNTALGDLDFKVIEKAFGDLFSGDLSQIPTDQLAAFKEQLEAMRDQAENLSPEQLQQIADVLGNIQTQMDLTSPINSIRKARQEYKKAKEDFEKFKKAAEKAKQEGNFEAEGKALEQMNKAQQKMNNAQNKLKFSTESLIEVVDEFGRTLDTAGDTIGGVTGEMLKLAASGIGAGVAMANGMKMFKEAADTASKSVAILAIIQAAFQAVMALIDMFGGKEDQTLTAYVDAMENYISMLTDAISDLKDEMSDVKNSMAETIAQYKELVALQEKSAAAIKAQSQVWLNSGASARAHSEGYKIAKAISDGLYSSSQEVRDYYKNGVNELSQYYQKVFGKNASMYDEWGRLNLGRLDWLWKLNDQDIKELAKNTELLSILGDELSSAIINYANSLQDMEDTLNEQYAALLSVSYDDFYTDFIDMVSDMDSTSADFAKRFGEYMRKALIQNLVATQYKERIKKLYEAAGKAAQNGTLEQELGALRDEWTQIAKEAREQVKLINDISGSNGTSEDGSSGSWQALGEETGRALEGRMTAIHIQTTIIAEMMLTNGEKLTEMQNLSMQKFSIINEMANLSFVANVHLERIARNTDPLPDMRTDIKKLVRNTDRL